MTRLVKGIWLPQLLVALTIMSAHAQGRVPARGDTAAERWVIAHEVEKREHAKATGVEIREPGIADVRFERRSAHEIEAGLATVRYTFVDPRTYPGTSEEQEALLARNPMGFAVLDYETRPVKASLP